MNAVNQSCPVCEEGVLEERVDSNEVEYKGVSGRIPQHFSVCTECGSEQGTADQVLANKRAMMAFRKEVDGLLRGEDVLRLRKQLGLTQAEAAKVFGGGPTAFAKYEADDVAQAAAMDRLLRVARDVPEAFVYLRQLSGMDVHPEPLASRTLNAGNETWRDFVEPMVEVDIDVHSNGVLNTIQSTPREYAS